MNNESQKSFPVWSLLLGLLTIVFITLKLTGFITWGWVWVFSPLWIPITVVCAVCVVILLFCCIVELIKKAVGR